MGERKGEIKLEVHGNKLKTLPRKKWSVRVEYCSRTYRPWSNMQVGRWQRLLISQLTQQATHGYCESQRPTHSCYVCPFKHDLKQTTNKKKPVLTLTCCKCFPGHSAGPIDVETPPARTLSTLATFLHLPPVPMTVRSPVMPRQMTPCP